MAVELGLGVLELGKPWGYAAGAVPTEGEAIELLEFAFELGIRYFDSAPSYGVAEARLGTFRRSLTSGQRSQVRIATKFGEHWNHSSNEPYVDHSFAALSASLGRSLETLGKIDVLQLHKTTPEVLRSDDLARAWERATACGIPLLGPSVSDTVSAGIACKSGRYQIIQLPFNEENSRFAEVIRAASDAGMLVATNRPFAMGKLMHSGGNRPAHEARVSAFAFILAQPFDGVVLTGTKSKSHLKENWNAFRQVFQQAR